MQQMSITQSPEIIGKKRRLASLSEASGRFSMLAIDQRQSLRKMISSQTGQAPESVLEESLVLVKRVITSRLAHKASAILTDPYMGYATTWEFIPGSTGVLLSLEQTGYSIVNNNERLTRLLADWSVEKALLAGADGIKLLVWYDKGASSAVMEHQKGIVQSTGEACYRHAIPFVLEVVCYSSDDIPTRGPEYAHEKAIRVIDAASEFSDPRYQVDLLKLEFPGNLKFVKEYQDRSFYGGSVIHDISEVRDFCRSVNDASRVPWVILSAGVEPEEFIEAIHLCNDAGASGFLCGRAVWQDVIKHFPNLDAMESYIETSAADAFDLILKANKTAVPWQQHKHFK